MTARSSPHQPSGRLIAVLLLVFGWAVPLAFPHLAADDLLCVMPAGAGDEPQQFIDGSAAGLVEHCAVCHTLRSFRSAGVAEGELGLAFNSTQHQLMRANARVGGAASHRLPARAPPA